MSDSLLYIHKYIKSITKNRKLKYLYVELDNRQVIKVPFDVVYKDGKSFVSERKRLHIYLQKEYERFNNDK